MMKIIQSGLLVAAGMVAMLAVQAVVPGGARAMPNPAPQQITPMPTPLPPNVVVTNEPTVNAKQVGTWTVQLEGQAPTTVAPVHLAAPGFLRAGTRYSFVWSEGAKPDVETVVSVASDGWVLVSGEANQAGAAWVNAARAIRIEQIGR